MKRKFFVTVIALITFHLVGNAQATLNLKLNLWLAKNYNSSQQIPLLVQGNILVIETVTKQLGGTFKYGIQNFASIVLPANKIVELTLNPSVYRVGGMYGEGKILDDATNANINLNPVQWGTPPLTQGYTGAGVIMGIIDTGIDFHHNDFKNANGTTRIQYLWDQNVSTGGTTPSPYNYGQEWTAANINAGTCTHDEATVYAGHGSNVSGIACGNGNAVNGFAGIAPDCDIVAVAVDLSANFLNAMVDAVQYIYSKAMAAGEPCVINASVGEYDGSHDGTDLAAQMIDALIHQQTGHAFVCAAGNGGNIPFHLGYTVTNDSSFTWFQYFSAIGGVYFEWWADTANFDQIQFSYGADKTSPWVSRGHVPYHTINDFNMSSGLDSLNDTLYAAGNRMGIITTYVQRDGPDYNVAVFIAADSTTYNWRLITKGSGHIDAWSSNSFTGTSNMATSGLPSSASFPDMVRYKYPDIKQTIVSSFTCSSSVISVANYTNRTEYIDFNGVIQTSLTDTAGTRALTSSIGPTRDNRQKPDMSAPGARTLATSELQTVYGLINTQPWKVAQGGMHNVNGGTSMASPVVAGLAALYLQMHNNATQQEIKDALQLSAVHDNYTGNNLPDIKWGFGKVNAWNLMNTIVTYGCTDPFSLNFNPAANVDDGSCVAIVFGCTDPTAINYNAAANMNDGSCNYNTFTGQIFSENGVKIFPVPSAEGNNFNILNSNNETIHVEVVNTIGQTMVSENVSSNTLLKTGNNLPAGFYFIKCIDDNNNRFNATMVIQ